MVQEQVRPVQELHVPAQDQPPEPGVAYQKRCRLNNWNTMKQQRSHSLIGNAGGVALRTSLLGSAPLQHEHVRTWCNFY